MSSLATLIELQSTHDYLQTIERDLTAFPPELAALDQKLKGILKELAQTQKGLDEGATKLVTLQKVLDEALKEEEHARSFLKKATQKVQYAAAIRDQDDKERARHQAERPVKELRAKQAELEARRADLESQRASVQAQFDEIHEVFLAEHGNQVAAKEQLQAKWSDLLGVLAPPDSTRFERLMQQRQGKAVAAVENGVCTGCRTKLRGPLVAQLRDAKVPTPCEACQRILYLR
jgi:hypothetical protein